VIGQAFDLAWAEIASNFAADPVVTAGARLTLANAILLVATEEGRDVEVLKKAGLEAMARNYTLVPIGNPKTNDQPQWSVLRQ